MNTIDEYGFNAQWIKPEVQAEVYRRMLKRKRLSHADNEYVLSHTVADPGFRRRLVAALTRIFKGEDRILSIAEGEGRLIAELTKRGFTGARGVDICTDLVELGQASGIRLEYGDATRLPFTDGSFEGVIINEAIGAIGLSQPLVEARRVLIPGGGLVITNYHYAEHGTAEVSSEIVKYRYIPTALVQKALADKGFTDITVRTIPIYSPAEIAAGEGSPDDRMDLIVARG